MPSKINQSHPYRLHVTKKNLDQGGQSERLAYDVDGVFYIIIKVGPENSFVTKAVNLNIKPFIVAQTAIEYVCANQGREFVEQLRGHLNIVLDDLEEKAQEGAKA